MKFSLQLSPAVICANILNDYDALKVHLFAKQK